MKIFAGLSGRIDTAVWRTYISGMIKKRGTTSGDVTLHAVKKRKSSASVTMEIPSPDPDINLHDSIPGYRIERKLSEGGQGIVYQALQESTRRKVAIKMMRGGAFTSTSENARFDREVQVLGRLSHPNIVTIHDSGMIQGSRYIVMDYIVGQPLDQYEKSRGAPGAIDDILRLFQKICTAINTAHLAGIIHRDLKPSNILIDSAGEPHILDFGLAKVPLSDSEVSMMTMTGHFIGSLPWASPEQAEGAPEKIDMRTDVYSLGVILYQILTGKFPYEISGNMRDDLGRIRHAEPQKPRAFRREINDEVETIVLKCLSKDRERRYQSAGELARDLKNYLDGLAISAKRDSFGYMMRKQLKRHKVPVAVGAGFISLIIVGLLISLALWRRAVSEGTTARFHLEAARNESNRSLEEYQSVIQRFRRAQELISVLPKEVRQLYPGDRPDTAFRDANTLIAELFPLSEDSPSAPSKEVLSQEVVDAIQACAAEPGHSDSRIAFEWLRTNQNRVTSLIETIHQHKLQFVSAVNSGRLIQYLLPSHKYARLAGNMLVANALFHYKESEQEAAIENLLASLYLSRYNGDHPFLISTLVEISCRNRIYSAYRWMAADTVKKRKIATSYLKFLEQDLPFPDFEQAYISEIRTQRQLLNEAFVKTSDKVPARLKLSYFRSLWKDLNIPESDNPYNNPTESMKADAESLSYEQAMSIITEFCGLLRTHEKATFQELKKKGEQIGPVINSHPALSPLLPDFTRALEMRRRAQMNRDATVIAAAIFAFRNSSGRWPESIDKALASFPITPFFRSYYGHDFIYRVTSGLPLLYTVGPNGIDDAGRGRRFESGIEDKAEDDDVLFLVFEAPGNQDRR